MFLTIVSQGCRLFSFMYISRVFGCSCFLILIKSKKHRQSIDYQCFFPVGVTGFEPATTRPPDAYSNRAELHPELRMAKVMLYFELASVPSNFICIIFL